MTHSTNLFCFVFSDQLGRLSVDAIPNSASQNMDGDKIGPGSNFDGRGTQDAQHENDMDAVLDLEISFQREGARLASEAGARVGLDDGRALGWASGAAISAEIAFYAGVATALTSLHLAPRPKHAAEKLVEASHRLRIHQIGNSKDDDFEQLLADVRNKFRNAVALAGLQRVRFDAEKPSRLTDYSF